MAQFRREGWTVLSIKNPESDPRAVAAGSVYETPEALLMAASPEFARCWGARLTDRLLQLEQLQRAASPESDDEETTA